MKKALGLVVMGILGISQLWAQMGGIEFDHRGWDTLLASAGEQNKLVFLDAYTSWCKPCKMMEAEVFTDPEVAAYFNAHFVNAKIDMEKGEGPALQRKYGVSSYPTFIFVNAEGQLVHSQSIIMTAAEFLEMGKQVLAPDFNSLLVMAKRFADGERDRGFLKDYLIRLDASSEDFPKVMAPFLPGMQGDGLLEENSWIVFRECIRDETTEMAQYFLSHRVAFERKYGVEDVQGKARELYMHMSRVAARKQDMGAFKRAQRAVRAAGLPDGDAQACWMEIDMYARAKDILQYARACDRLYRATPGYDLDQKFWQGRDVASVAEKKAELRLPLKWLKEVAAERMDYESFKTLALIQFKMGKTKEGAATAAKAIAVAKLEGRGYAEVTDMLGKYGTR